MIKIGILNGFVLPILFSHIKGMTILLKHYQDEGYLEHCPLCKMVGSCDSCPWNIMENSECLEYYKRNFPSLWENFSLSRIRNLHKEEMWSLKRIEQLKEWINIYETYIKRNFSQKGDELFDERGKKNMIGNYEENYIVNSLKAIKLET